MPGERESNGPPLLMAVSNIQTELPDEVVVPTSGRKDLPHLCAEHAREQNATGVERLPETTKGVDADVGFHSHACGVSDDLSDVGNG